MSMRLAACWLGLWAGACQGAEAPARPEVVTLAGRAVTLIEALKPLGLAVDAEPAGSQVVVQGTDGGITPLLADEASRALFVEKQLRDRRVEIRGRRFPGSPFVQVLTYQVEDRGAMRTPEYFCEICTISVRAPQPCPCCQGPMELRMRPSAP